MDKFTYLGSTLSRNVVIDDKMNARLAKASIAFGRLHKNVWNSRGIIIGTTMRVYWAIILTTLLYGYETWTVYQHHAKKLNHFHMYSAKMGSIWAGQYWLYWAKRVAFCQMGCIWPNVVPFGKNGCILGKYDSIWAKLVVFGQNWLY